jgi:hypothetical protein
VGLVHEVHGGFNYLDRIDNALILLNTFTNVSQEIHETKRSPGAKWGALHDLKFVVNRPAGGLAHVHEVHRRSDYLDRIDNALISLNTFTNVSRMIHETKRSPGAKWGALHDLKFVVNRPAGGLAHVHEVHRRSDYLDRIDNALISLNTFTNVSRMIHETKGYYLVDKCSSTYSIGA